MVKFQAPSGLWDDVVVLDSGGSAIKFGLVTASVHPRTVPNCVGRLKGDRAAYVADAILTCRDACSLAVRRPVDRGYAVSWTLQRDIWARVVQGILGISKAAAKRRVILLTEPAFTLPALRDAAARTVLEDLGFGAVVFAAPAELIVRALCSSAPGMGKDLLACSDVTPSETVGSPHEAGLTRGSTSTSDAAVDLPLAGPVPLPDLTLLAHSAGCALVIDAGFSFTHITPVFDGMPIPRGIVRIDLGGKALTNHMKDVLSYRSINVQGEPLLVDKIKETLCFVSQDPLADLAVASRRDSPHRREYILPDGVRDTWGHVRGAPGAREPDPGDAVLQVNNERFMVPELIFRPSDIGLDECGIAEAAARAVAKTHPHLHALLWSNVVLAGGCTACPGFASRLQLELRPLVPDEYTLSVWALRDPVTAALKGGLLLAADAGELEPRLVTATDYQTSGAAALVHTELVGTHIGAEKAASVFADGQRLPAVATLGLPQASGW